MLSFVKNHLPCILFSLNVGQMYLGWSLPFALLDSLSGMLGLDVFSIMGYFFSYSYFDYKIL